MSNPRVEAMGVHLDQRRRLLIAAPPGVIAGGVVAFLVPWKLSVLVDLAYLFGTVIVGIAINVVGNLIR